MNWLVGILFWSLLGFVIFLPSFFLASQVGALMAQRSPEMAAVVPEAAWSVSILVTALALAKAVSFFKRK